MTFLLSPCSMDATLPAPPQPPPSKKIEEEEEEEEITQKQPSPPPSPKKEEPAAMEEVRTPLANIEGNHLYALTWGRVRSGV